MEAKCDFGDQTDSLIMDTFIQNMNNKTVQQNLCKEPKENPEEVFCFAIAYEEGVNQHKAFEATTGTKEIKQEPIMNINRSPCTRCGLEITQTHLMACKAKNGKCRNCAMTGHFARMCKRPKTGNIRGRVTMPGRGGLKRIEQDDSQSESSNEMNEENLVLHVSGAGNQPFVLKGKINKEPFKTMIDSGSPITIFTQEDLRKILKVDVIFARPVPKNEQYVGYHNKPLNLLGLIQVGKKKLKNARILITRDGKRSLE